MTAPASAIPLAVVGRQPIFDRRLGVYGYELLFRLDSTAPEAGVTAGDVSTALVVVNSFVEIGLENVVGTATAFVNVNRAFLLSDLILNLPSDRVVLEVLEHVPPDSDVIARLDLLRAAGYRLALDDFVYREDLEPFIELASIVKLDISQLERPDLPVARRAAQEAGDSSWWRNASRREPSSTPAAPMASTCSRATSLRGQRPFSTTAPRTATACPPFRRWRS